MSITIKVAILGATGRTGSSIVSALLASSDPKFEVTGLIRPSSIDKSSTTDLAKRDVKVVVADLHGPQDALVSVLKGIDVVIVSISPPITSDEITLADAALKAGVKRFVPNAWAPVAPPRGVMMLRESKEDVLDHLKKIYLPFTHIDTGFWHEVMITRVPSGKLDKVAEFGIPFVIGEGNTPTAIIDIFDIGAYVARIIVDPRTLNRMVFAYGEVLTQKEAIATVERVTGEKVAFVEVAPEKVVKVAGSNISFLQKAIVQYYHIAYVRGDNQPAKARFLGYLDGKELYPDLKIKPLEESVRDGLAGRGYQDGAVGNPEFWTEIAEAFDVA
ncbi:hypothetical protein C8Q75DRAFT_770263 [Abortiporus biennis]|nr:hypothetical protein C8Q75DRAFT_770263 [Abortiporus biennis]